MQNSSMFDLDKPSSVNKYQSPSILDTSVDPPSFISYTYQELKKASLTPSLSLQTLTDSVLKPYLAQTQNTQEVLDILEKKAAISIAGSPSKQASTHQDISNELYEILSRGKAPLHSSASKKEAGYNQNRRPNQNNSRQGAPRPSRLSFNNSKALGKIKQANKPSNPPKGNKKAVRVCSPAKGTIQNTVQTGKNRTKQASKQNLQLPVKGEIYKPIHSKGLQRQHEKHVTGKSHKVKQSNALATHINSTGTTPMIPTVYNSPDSSQYTGEMYNNNIPIQRQQVGTPYQIGQGPLPTGLDSPVNTKAQAAPGLPGHAATNTIDRLGALDPQGRTVDGNNAAGIVKGANANKPLRGLTAAEHDKLMQHMWLLSREGQTGQPYVPAEPNKPLRGLNPQEHDKLMQHMWLLSREGQNAAGNNAAGIVKGAGLSSAAARRLGVALGNLGAKTGLPEAWKNANPEVIGAILGGGAGIGYTGLMKLLDPDNTGWGSLAMNSLAGAGAGAALGYVHGRPPIKRPKFPHLPIDRTPDTGSPPPAIDNEIQKLIESGDVHNANNLTGRISAASVSTPIVKEAVTMSRGSGISRSVANTLGRILGVPRLAMINEALQDPSADFKRRDKIRKTLKLMDDKYPDELSDTHVNLGGTDTIDDVIWKKEREGKSLPWYKQIGGRVLQNKKTGPLGKLIGYPFTPAANLMASLTRGSYYNNFTDSFNKMDNNEALTELQLGQAADLGKITGNPDKGDYLDQVGKGTTRDLYKILDTAALGIPVLAGGINTSRKALREGLKDNPEELKRRMLNRKRVIPAVFGNILGGMAGAAIPNPLGAVAGATAGSLIGRTGGSLVAGAEEDDYEYEKYKAEQEKQAMDLSRIREMWDNLHPGYKGLLLGGGAGMGLGGLAQLVAPTEEDPDNPYINTGLERALGLGVIGAGVGLTAGNTKVILDHGKRIKNTPTNTAPNYPIETYMDPQYT